MAIHRRAVRRPLGIPVDIRPEGGDLLILRTLLFGPYHGQGIARMILRQSEEVFFVDRGSLYLALQRLEEKKMIAARWGLSENNRKARFHTLTAEGRRE